MGKFKNSGYLRNSPPNRLNSGSALRRKLAFNTETWVDGGLWYFVLGDASPSDVHDLSELLRSANR
jgi:hypothetical protein